MLIQQRTDASKFNLTMEISVPIQFMVNRQYCKQQLGRKTALHFWTTDSSSPSQPFSDNRSLESMSLQMWA